MQSDTREVGQLTDPSVKSERSRAGREMLLMRQAANLLAAELSLSELFERLTRMLAEYIDSSVVFIALTKPDGRHAVEYVYDHGEIRRYPHMVLSENSRALAVIRSGKIIWGNSPDVWAPMGKIPLNLDRPWTDDSVSAIFVPMFAGGTNVGCLSVQSLRSDAYGEHEVEVVAAIGHYLGVAVQNQRMYQALTRTAEYDSLTGLANRSKLTRELESALATATSTRPAAAVMLDIVNFAMFNETYGYAEGDGVLRLLAQTLREFEDADAGVAVGRFGGDAFMAIVREAVPEEIGAFVARLSARLRELSFIEGNHTLPISVACGYVVAPLDGRSVNDVIALCVHRSRLSRTQNCRLVSEDEIESFTLHGAFTGIETIVDGLLARDPYTRAHVLHVNAMAKLWSEYNLELAGRDLATLLQASVLHDVGTMLIPDAIIVKPSRLTDQEYERARQHPIYGRDILARQPGFAEVAEIVAQHHERWDGTGYPRGLTTEEIHPLARAISILEAFSAMVADRPYHRGITEEAALAELERCAGVQFDPALVERFVAWREEGDPPRLA